MAEFNQNIWSPWRLEYIKSLYEEGRDQGCFLCQHWGAPDQDRKNHVLWRTEHCFAVLNKFPYTGGHLLAAPAVHQGDFQELPVHILADIMSLLRDGQKLLNHVVKPQGFNMGINIGRCAGAGVPDHLHAHLIPRWTGDTNFLPVLSDVRIVPVMLDELYQAMVEAAPTLDLPLLAGADQ